jgi:hypothetical protein
MEGKWSNIFGAFWIALPIAHLLSASLFLWAYCTAFGARISIFISATDVFNASIRDMLPIYILGLLWPAWLNLKAYIPRHVGNHRDPGEEFIPGAKWSIVEWITLGAGVIGLVLSIPLFMKPPPYPFSFFIQIFIIFYLVLLFRAASTWKTTRMMMDMAVMVGAFILVVLAYGFDKGHNDRYRIYSESILKYPSCKNVVLFRKFGEYYLGVVKDDRKVMVDKDCKVALIFPNPGTRPPLSW